MSSEESSPSDRQQVLEDVCLAYLKAQDAGLMEELSAFLADEQIIARVVAPLVPVPSSPRSMKVRSDRVSVETATLKGGDEGPEENCGVDLTIPDHKSPVPSGGEAGFHFGDYEVRDEIARGGMGVVYRAWQLSLTRFVALKLIRSGLLASPAEVRNFRAEAGAAAHLDHPNIVPIYEVGERQGQHFYSMRLVEGGDLSRHVPHFVADPRAAARLMATVAHAVHYAHQRGILHRDLKPKNILLEWPAGASAPIPHVTDFGLAKIMRRSDAADTEEATISHAIEGTLEYMAPEQARPDKVLTVRADVYSLGSILYTLLTGRPPFQANALLEMIRQVVEQNPTSPRQLNRSVHRDLETICLKCLAKEPARRYGSAEKLAEDLELWLAGEVILGRRAGKAEKVWRWCRRNSLVASLSAALLLAVVFGLITSILLLFLAERRGDQATANYQAAMGQAKIAREKNNQYRHVLYTLTLQKAFREWEDGHIGVMTELLDGEACRPTLPGQEELRGWEWHYVRGLAHKEARSLDVVGDSNHPVVVFSPDGRYMANAVSDTITIRDFSNGVIKHTLKVSAAGFRGLAYNPNGRELVSVGVKNSRLIVWDAASGQAIRTFTAHESGISAVAFSPDGIYVATGGFSDFQVKLWRSGTWEFVGFFPVHGGTRGLAFSPNSKYLASAGSDGEARLWQVENRKEVVTFHGHTDKVNCIVYSPNGEQVATASEDYTVRLWDVRKGTVIHALSGHRGYVYAVAFRPDGRLVASASDDATVRVWDVVNGKEQRIFRGHTDLVRGVAFSPDGVWLASAGSQGSLKIWNLAAPSQQFHVLPIPGPTTRVNKVAFNATGTLLASAGQDGRVRLWDVVERKELRGFPGHRSEVFCVAFSPDGSRIASSSGDGTLKIWDTATGVELWTVSTSGQARQLAFSPDGLLVASSGANDTVKLFRVADGEEIASRDGHKSVVRAVAIAPGTGELASASIDNTIILWGPNGGSEPRVLTGHDADLWSIAFSPDGQQLASGDRRGVIKVWDVARGVLLRTLHGHSLAVMDLSFHPGGRLASASLDQSVKIWDVAAGLEILTLKASPFPVSTAVFSPDGRWLASSGNDSAIRLWDGKPGD